MNTAEANKALVERFGYALNNRRLDLLDGIVAPDFVRHCQATPDVAVNSLEAFKAYLREDSRIFPDSRQTLKFKIAEGDLVAIWFTYEATQQGRMGPFPPSGRRMNLDISAILRIREGKIAEMWVTWDNLAGLAQLGHLEQAAGQPA